MRNRKNPIQQLGRLAKILSRSHSLEDCMTALLQESAAFFGALAGRIVLIPPLPESVKNPSLEIGTPFKDALRSSRRDSKPSDADIQHTGDRSERGKPAGLRAFVYVQGRGISQCEFDPGEILGGLIEGTLQHGRTALVRDINPQTPQPLEPILGLDIEFRSAICAPIGEGAGLLGTIEFLDRRAGNFEKTDLDLLETVAALAETTLCRTEISCAPMPGVDPSDPGIACLQQAAEWTGLLKSPEGFQRLIEPLLQGMLQSCGARRALWMERSGEAFDSPRFRIQTECRAASVDPAFEGPNLAVVDLEKWIDEISCPRSEPGQVLRLTAGAAKQIFDGIISDHPARFEIWLQPVRLGDRTQGAIALVDPEYFANPVPGSTQTLMRIAADFLSFAMDREQTRSDRCRLELQIQNSQKLESLGELASGISHNFRNILAGIIANCQLLEMRCPDYPDLRKNLTGIHNLAQIGSELVNNLLKFARKGNGKEKQIFNLAEVLEETVQIITPSFDKNITINGDWENPLPMEGVRSELSQLVMNLCTNARDAMSEGGILQITARPLPAKNKIYLAVSDTGSGMDEPIRKRIFEPFFTTKAPGRGTGLGLSTAYGIVRDHEGEITVNSKPGVGSIFQILFPMAEVRGVEEKAPPMEIIEGRGERVLVIDDDRGLLQTVEALMAGIGYQAVTTESGQRGIELYCSDPPDVVLIDRSMPETDGITAAGEILSFDPKARIIIVSGYEEEGPNALEEPIKSRIRAYVTKPFDISDLSRVLAEVLRDGDGRRAERCSNP